MTPDDLKKLIKPRVMNCSGCGIVVQVDKYFRTDDWVGFQSDTHEPCGEYYRITTAISTDPEVRNNFIRFVEMVSL